MAEAATAEAGLAEAEKEAGCMVAMQAGVAMVVVATAEGSVEKRVAVEA